MDKQGDVVSEANGVRAAWDREQALDRLDGDEHLLRLYVGHFLKNVAGYLRDMEQAVRAGDWETVSRETHTIKGIAAQFEALATYHAAVGVESVLEEGTLSKLNEALQIFRGEVQKFIEALSAYEGSAKES